MPYDIVADPPRILGSVAEPYNLPVPPRYTDIADLIAPAEDPNRWFSPEELSTAEWLRGRGLDVASVERRTGHLLKTPDAVAVGHPITIELKRAVGTANSIVQRLRNARWQARHVVIDLRDTGTTLDLAGSALSSALRMYGDHLDEVVLILSNDLSVGWHHG